MKILKKKEKKKICFTAIEIEWFSVKVADSEINVKKNSDRTVNWTVTAEVTELRRLLAVFPNH